MSISLSIYLLLFKTQNNRVESYITIITSYTLRLSSQFLPILLHHLWPILISNNQQSIIAIIIPTSAVSYIMSTHRCDSQFVTIFRHKSQLQIRSQTLSLYNTCSSRVYITNKRSSSSSEYETLASYYERLIKTQVYLYRGKQGDQMFIA